VQSTGFVLSPDGRVVVSVYSSGAIGRLVPEDVIGLITYLRSRAAETPEGGPLPGPPAARAILELKPDMRRNYVRSSFGRGQVPSSTRSVITSVWLCDQGGASHIPERVHTLQTAGR
jgi:hypothetical protein